ncbi:hypothetical protein VTK73DRAFT_4225 [Phialemonium thermophilum]|uniref:Uncharacterized protein n=1 Tax=Phialemonium thermophilum TaxID=223376 RepID=A0ABR3WUJ6_9PEZI
MRPVGQKIRLAAPCVDGVVIGSARLLSHTVRWEKTRIPGSFLMCQAKAIYFSLCNTGTHSCLLSATNWAYLLCVFPDGYRRILSNVISRLEIMTSDLPGLKCMQAETPPWCPSVTHKAQLLHICTAISEQQAIARRGKKKKIHLWYSLYLN